MYHCLLVVFYGQIKDTFGTNQGTEGGCVIPGTTVHFFLLCSALDCSFPTKSRWRAIHAPSPSLFPSVTPRGQGWFPVILALRVNVCCSISTSIKLFLSCSAVTESTAHDCRLRGLDINHTDCVRAVRARACVRTRMWHRSPLFTSHRRI